MNAIQIHISLFESSSQELCKGVRVQCDKMPSLRAIRHHTEYMHMSYITYMNNKKARHRTSCKTGNANIRILRCIVHASRI